MMNVPWQGSGITEEVWPYHQFVDRRTHSEHKISHCSSPMRQNQILVTGINIDNK